MIETGGFRGHVEMTAYTSTSAKVEDEVAHANWWKMENCIYWMSYAISTSLSCSSGYLNLRSYALCQRVGRLLTNVSRSLSPEHYGMVAAPGGCFIFHDDTIGDGNFRTLNFNLDEGNPDHDVT